MGSLEDDFVLALSGAMATWEDPRGVSPFSAIVTHAFFGMSSQVVRLFSGRLTSMHASRFVGHPGN